VSVVLASGSVFLDTTVVNVALPAMGEDLPSAVFGRYEAQNYVYYGYLLALSSLLMLAGGLSDHAGRRRTYLVGLIGFGVTSLLCGLAPTMDLLIVFRLLQGAAGALLVPGSLAIITATFEGDEQGRAFGIWAAASAVTSILGPVVGGVLVEGVTWRAVFLVHLPLIGVAVWGAWRHIEESSPEEVPFDGVGATLAAVAVGGLAFGAIRGQSSSWEGAVPYVSLSVGVGAAVALPWWMRRVANPLVPLEVFRSRNFVVTNVSTLLIYGALYVMLQVLALYTVGILGYTEVAFGIGVVPMSLFLAVSAGRFGQIAARVGPRRFMAAGPVMSGIGLLWLARLPDDSSPWRATGTELASYIPSRGYVVDLLPGLVLFGLGLMVMVPPLTMTLMRSLPVRHAGIGSAFNNAVSRVGPQLVGALLFVAITASFQSAMWARFPDLDITSPEARQRISPLNRPDPSVPERVAGVAREASGDAFRLAMGVAGFLAIVGGVVNGIGISDREALHPPHSEASASGDD